jgi:hypothetical protein
MGGLFDSKPLHHGEPIRRDLLGPSLTNRPIALIAGSNACTTVCTISHHPYRNSQGFPSDALTKTKNTRSSLQLGRCWSDAVFKHARTHREMFTPNMAFTLFSQPPLCECLSLLAPDQQRREELEPLDSDLPPM